MEADVRIFEWTPGFCHAKMSIADNIMATCGTINLDYRSLYHHFEDGCFLLNYFKQELKRKVSEVHSDPKSSLTKILV